MSNVLNLLKLQIDNKTDILKIKSPKKMIFSILKVAILLAVISAFVWSLEGRIFILGVKVNAELIAIILLVTQIISLLFAIGSIISTLYLSKDNEMLVCFPVSANQLFISKIILIYLKELAVNSIITIPIFVGLGFIGQLGITFFVTLLILLLLLPILPIVLASLLSIVVMMIIKFLRKHTTLSIISILVLVMGCLLGYVMLVGNIMSSFNIASEQLETVTKINSNIIKIGSKLPVFYELGLAMISFTKWHYLLGFILICFILLIFTISIIKPFYFKTATSHFENNTKITNTPGKFKKCSPFISLIKKEIISIFRSPSEIFEYFIFTLLMPFIVFSYDKLLMSISVTQAGVNMIAGSHIMVLAILAMLSNIISASAISREGNTFYISKIIPVNYYTQVFAKLTFNIMFTAISLFITMFVGIFMYPAWKIILGTIAVLFIAIGHAAMSIEMDIKNPSKNFQGDEKSSTTSKSTPKSIIYALLIGFVIGLTIILMSSFKYPVVPYLIIMAIGFVFMLRKLYVLILRINLSYNKIEM